MILRKGRRAGRAALRQAGTPCRYARMSQKAPPLGQFSQKRYTETGDLQGIPEGEVVGTELASIIIACLTKPRVRFGRGPV